MDRSKIRKALTGILSVNDGDQSLSGGIAEIVVTSMVENPIYGYEEKALDISNSLANPKVRAKVISSPLDNSEDNTLAAALAPIMDVHKFIESAIVKEFGHEYLCSVINLIDSDDEDTLMFFASEIVYSIESTVGLMAINEKSAMEGVRDLIDIIDIIGEDIEDLLGDDMYDEPVSLDRGKPNFVKHSSEVGSSLDNEVLIKGAYALINRLELSEKDKDGLREMAKEVDEDGKLVYSTSDLLGIASRRG